MEKLLAGKTLAVHSSAMLKEAGAASGSGGFVAANSCAVIELGLFEKRKTLKATAVGGFLNLRKIAAIDPILN
jgi:hypothetical protein